MIASTDSAGRPLRTGAKWLGLTVAFLWLVGCQGPRGMRDPFVAGDDPTRFSCGESIMPSSAPRSVLNQPGAAMSSGVPQHQAAGVPLAPNGAPLQQPQQYGMAPQQAYGQGYGGPAQPYPMPQQPSGSVGKASVETRQGINFDYETGATSVSQPSTDE